MFAKHESHSWQQRGVVKRLTTHVTANTHPHSPVLCGCQKRSFARDQISISPREIRRFRTRGGVLLNMWMRQTSTVSTRSSNLRGKSIFKGTVSRLCTVQRGHVVGETRCLLLTLHDFLPRTFFCILFRFFPLAAASTFSDRSSPFPFLFAAGRRGGGDH